MAETAISLIKYVLWVLMIDSHDSLHMKAYVSASYYLHFISTVSYKFGQLTRIFGQMVHRLLRQKIIRTLMAMSSNLLITLVVLPSHYKQNQK